MRIPEPGPLGETFFEAKERAMVAASLVKSPLGGKVETVVTPATQRLLERVLAEDFLPAEVLPGMNVSSGCESEMRGGAGWMVRWEKKLAAAEPGSVARGG